MEFNVPTNSPDKTLFHKTGIRKAYMLRGRRHDYANEILMLVWLGLNLHITGNQIKRDTSCIFMTSSVPASQSQLLGYEDMIEVSLNMTNLKCIFSLVF